AAKEAAVDRVPDGAPTSAIYNLLPHLAHRDEIYDFPEPWRHVNWGVDGENMPDPAGVQWIVIDRRVLNAHDLPLPRPRLHRQSRPASARDAIGVARGVPPPPPGG